jgi:hypothetical protein
MIALDTTALSLLFIPESVVCKMGTTVPVRFAKQRMEFLIESISKKGDKILIPTPALSEILVRVPPARIPELLAQLHGSAWFSIEPFDSASAVELGMRTAKAIATGDKKEGIQADWTKVKFDRQIITIAIVNQAEQIISNDPHLKALGDRWGYPVIGIEELPLPESLIAPPLLAPLQEEYEEHNEARVDTSPAVLRRRGNGFAPDQATSETVEALKGRQKKETATGLTQGE